LYRKGDENICNSSGGAQEKDKDRLKLGLSPKLVKKLLWVPVILFWKIFIPSYAFDALLCQNWLFLPATVNEHPPAHHPLDVRYYSVVDEPHLS
jgi:hypothetical protein